MIGKFIDHGSRGDRSPRRTGKRAVASIAYVLDAVGDKKVIVERVKETSRYVLDLNCAGQEDCKVERVRVAGVRNLKGDWPAAWQGAMAAVAMQVSTACDPIEHIVLSLPRDERLTDTQAEDAVATVAEMLDAVDLQIVWSVHVDTENDHIHIILNRVSPRDFKLRELAGGWQRDRLQQSIALIEVAHGWMHEPNAVYVANKSGEIRHRKTARLVRDSAGRQLTRQGDRADDLAKLRAHPALLALREALEGASNWAEVHSNLDRLGASFERKGSGAIVVRSNAAPIKASAIAETCSWGALERRLGAYRPASDAADNDAAEAAAKQVLKKALEQIATARAETRRVLQMQLEQTLMEIDRRCADKKTAKSIAEAARAEFARAWNLAAADFARSRDDVRQQMVLGTVKQSVVDTRLPLILTSPDLPLRSATVVHGYVAEPIADGLAYHRTGRPSSFTDHRWYIACPAAAADRDRIAALQLAAARWTVVTVTGSPEQVQASLAVAQRLGIATRTAHARTVPEMVNYPSVKSVNPTQSERPDTTARRDLFVYVSETEMSDMKRIVAACGHATGVRGAVRFDAKRNAWRIAAEHLAPADTARLATALSHYMSSNPRQVVKAAPVPAHKDAARTSSATPRPHLEKTPSAMESSDQRPAESAFAREPPRSSVLARLHKQDAARSRTSRIAALSGRSAFKKDTGLER